jgi:uncharacterized protein YjcR
MASEIDVLNDPSWLREKYHEQGMGVVEISEQLGCSNSTVSRWMKKHDIETCRAAHPKLEDGDWLREKYHGEKLSTKEIAELLDCARNTVTRWMDIHDIEARETGQAVRMGWEDWEPDHVLSDDDLLRELYQEEKKSSEQIASELGFDPVTVRRYLEKYDIDIRDRSEALQIHTEREDELGDEEWLREKYIQEKKNMTEISEMLDVSLSTVKLWIERHGIEKRPVSEVNRLASSSGEAHHSWRGGQSYNYGPGWNDRKKRLVRERDQYECQRCGISNNTHMENHGQQLHVHHIVPARYIDDPYERNAKSNLVTLCRTCHFKSEQMAPLLPSGVSAPEQV